MWVVPRQRVHGNHRRLPCLSGGAQRDRSDQRRAVSGEHGHADQVDRTGDGRVFGTIQYQFWLYSVATGWKLVQPYGASQTFTWTPTWGNEGSYVVEVRARSNGSTLDSESSRTSAPTPSNARR